MGKSWNEDKDTKGTMELASGRKLKFCLLHLREDIYSC